MKRIAIAITMLAAVALLLGEQPNSSEAAQGVVKIMPSKGKVGNAGIIHGDGFLGSNIEVKFGSAPLDTFEIKTGSVVTFDIPARVATDPQIVPVEVKVNGNVVSSGLTFEYDPPGYRPIVIDVAPRVVPAAGPVVVTFTGDNFTQPAGRMPNAIYALGPTAVQGAIIGTPTNTSFEASFGAGLPPGVYELVVGFSDASGASFAGLEAN